MSWLPINSQLDTKFEFLAENHPTFDVLLYTVQFYLYFLWTICILLYFFLMLFIIPTTNMH